MSNHPVAAVVLGLALLGASRLAHAADEAILAPRVAREPPRTTVLLTPHFFEFYGELSVEHRVVPWLGLVALGGGGWASAKFGPNDYRAVPAYDVGAEVKAHATTRLDAALLSDLAFGVQVLYGHLRESAPAMQNPFLLPPGLSVAPLLHAGAITRSGFTFTVDMGLAFYLYEEPLERRMFPGPRLAFFERTNLGWSF
jgi:hypothetical protein